MQGLKNIQAESLIYSISEAVEPDSTVITDEGKGYVSARMPVARHNRRTMKGKEALKHLP